jgi:hypothetical protein
MMPVSRPSARLALVAVLAQVLLPHLHTWQGASHVGRLTLATPLAGPGIALATSEDRTSQGSHHDGATCPVCRVMGQSHLVALSSAPSVVAPTASGSHLPDDTAPSSVAPHRAGAGPRAPPPPSRNPIS